MALQCPDCEGCGSVLIDIKIQDGIGAVEEHGPCDTCHGRGEIPCPVCDDSMVLFDRIIDWYTYEDSEGNTQFDYVYEDCPRCVPN